MSNEFAASGCADIRFVPGATDEWRFGKRQANLRDFDVVLIGNNVSSRVHGERCLVSDGAAL